MNGWFPKALIGLFVLAFVGIVVTNVVWAVTDDDDDGRRVETITVADGEGSSREVVVVDGDDHWRRGPGFFPLIPLLIIGGIVFLIWRWRGGGDGPGGPRGRFDEWHDAAHRRDEPTPQA